MGGSRLWKVTTVMIWVEKVLVFLLRGCLWEVVTFKGLTVILFFLAAHLGWICITAAACNRVFSFRLPEHARCWQNSTSTLQITVLMYSLHLCRSSILCKRTVVTLRETHQVKVMFRNCYPVYSSVGRSAEQEDISSNPSQINNQGL